MVRVQMVRWRLPFVQPDDEAFVAAEVDGILYGTLFQLGEGIEEDDAFKANGGGRKIARAMAEVENDEKGRMAFRLPDIRDQLGVRVDRTVGAGV